MELALADPRADVLVPWEGKSPRVLTKAFRMFSLGALPARGLRDLVGVPAQKVLRSSD